MQILYEEYEKEEVIPMDLFIDADDANNDDGNPTTAAQR